MCTAVPTDMVQHMLQHLNSIESDGKLPYLDVSIERLADGSLKTCIYRKPTHTDKYLDYASHHPLSHKRSGMYTHP